MTRTREMVNPVIGQRLVVRRGGEETAGKLLELEAFYRPGSVEPAEHYHPYQEEQFEVLEGALTVRLQGRLQTLRAGDVLVIPAGARHGMWNAGDTEARAVWQTYPALETEAFLETACALAQAGKTDRNGLPNPLQLAVTLSAHTREFRLSRPPYPVQRLVFGLLALIGRALGYTPDVPYRPVNPPAGTAATSLPR